MRKKVLHNYNYYANIKAPFNKIKKGIDKMANKINTKAHAEKTNNKSKKNYKNGIIGVMQLFAVASIAYSTIVIAIGTEGVVPLIMVTPQAILAVAIAINKFAK